MADTLDLRRALMRCGECKHRFGADAVFCPFDGAKLEPVIWDAAGDPLLHTVVGGRYEVVGVLGEGGMGTVYQVRHTALDRLFAMKVLRRDLAADPDLAARFIREARATASVKHPNVVAITDFGRLDDGAVPYFVMEHLVGQTLAQAIKAGGAIAAPLAVKIVQKVAGALGAAHEAKIVHRDLKPDNVFLLGAPGGDVDVRVVDFGAALILGTSRVTKTGVVFGTPHYMSPEQASGQAVDHRADIYALGVIMYEMFTGRVPFVADTYMGVLTQHMFVKPVPPSQVSESAKELGALEEVTLRALEKKAELRYASMKELADHVTRVTSFAPDGSMRVEPASPRQESALARADELDSVSAASVTRPSARRRRGIARAWTTYGAIAIGVATLTLLASRLLRARGAEDAMGTAATSTAIATPTPTPTPTPTATPTPTSAPSPTSPPPPTASIASAPLPPRRAPRPAPSASKPPSAIGDFKDPWAK